MLQDPFFTSSSVVNHCLGTLHLEFATSIIHVHGTLKLVSDVQSVESPLPSTCTSPRILSSTCFYKVALIKFKLLEMLEVKSGAGYAHDVSLMIGYHESGGQPPHA